MKLIKGESEERDEESSKGMKNRFGLLGYEKYEWERSEWFDRRMCLDMV